jgi:acyl-coenzyme A synthetase/AMP-(fatty) acid ligase
LQGAVLNNHYGPSETHVITSYELSGDSDTWMDLPPIGKAIANTEVLILDKNMQPVNSGETGELYLKGVCLAHGYLNNPEITAERFIKNNRYGRLYRSGDLGYMTATGDIQYLGRSDGQVKIRGYRIEMGEIELAMEKIVGVDQSAVKAIEEDGEKFLVGYYTGQAEINELREKLRLSLPEYMVPSFILSLDSMPLTPSGKVDRKKASSSRKKKT